MSGAMPTFSNPNDDNDETWVSEHDRLIDERDDLEAVIADLETQLEDARRDLAKVNEELDKF